MFDNFLAFFYWIQKAAMSFMPYLPASLFTPQFLFFLWNLKISWI
jgi:hypothetical protein